MGVQNNRLLLELETAMRDINQEVINPQISDVTMDNLKPIMTMVAQARTTYLKELFELAKTVGEAGILQTDQVKRLKLYRLTYEELVAASQALEAAIDRGYLDVKRD